MCRVSSFLRPTLASQHLQLAPPQSSSPAAQGWLAATTRRQTGRGEMIKQLVKKKKKPQQK